MAAFWQKSNLVFLLYLKKITKQKMFIFKLPFNILMVCIIGFTSFNLNVNAQSEEDVLPKAAMINPELEAKIVKAINQHAKKRGWKEIFYRTIITSEEWSVLRDFNTGGVSGRIIDAVVIAKWPDGHCTFREFKIKQEYDGKSYSKEVSRYSSTYPATCFCVGF
jgi:hypothetical protein